MGYLWRSKTGLSHLDRALGDIVDIAWESAAPPSIFMLAAVILWHVQPVSLLFRIPSFPSTETSNDSQEYEIIFFLLLATGKLYTLGFLRTLNSRALFRAQMSSGALGRISLSREYSRREPRTSLNVLRTSGVPGVDSSPSYRVRASH